MTPSETAHNFQRRALFFALALALAVAAAVAITSFASSDASGGPTTQDLTQGLTGISSFQSANATTADSSTPQDVSGRAAPAGAGVAGASSATCMSGWSP